VAGAKGTVESVESIFAHIIITLIALAVMWTGVKVAVSYDKVTQAAFAPFAKLGDSAVHFIQHAPSYLPLPHPAFQALTPSGISAIADSMRRSVDEHELAERKSLSEIINNPGLMGGISNLKESAGDLKRTAEILEENRGLAPAQSAFEPLKESIEK